MDHVKWKISEKDMNAFIKSWKDYETALDLLIIKQKVTYAKLLKDLDAIKVRTRPR
jgi:polyphosphate kinase 2 (PPK2 family)